MRTLSAPRNRNQELPSLDLDFSWWKSRQDTWDVGYLPCGTMLGMNGEDLYRRTKDSQWTTYFLLTAIMGEGYPQRILQNLLSHIYIPLNSKELKSASGFSQVFSDSCWIKITLKPRVERLKVQGGHFKIAWMINYQPQLITPPQV